MGEAQKAGVSGARGSSLVYNVQALRAVAALSVVYYHLQAPLRGYAGMTLDDSWGAAGVDIFFVISGFIIFYTSSANRRTRQDFIVERIIRIVPMYWIATFAIAAINLAGFELASLRAFSASDLINSLLFIPHTRADGDAGPILAVGWTLSYEMYFYVVFALLMVARSIKVLLGAIATYMISVYALSLVVPIKPAAIAYFADAIVLEFVMGCCLGALYTNPNALRGAGYLWSGFAAIALGATVILVMGVQHPETVFLSRELRVLVAGLPAWAIVAGALALERNNVIVRSRAVLLLGAASYSIYLFHPLVIQPAVKATLVARSILPGVPIPNAAIILAGFCAPAAAGVVIYLMLEKPLARGLKAQVRGRAGKVRARAA